MVTRTRLSNILTCTLLILFVCYASQLHFSITRLNDLIVSEDVSNFPPSKMTIFSYVCMEKIV